jgi:purine-binding chemotaxis protein CheW
MADLLVFHLSGQRYALASATVREIVRAVAIVPLPQAPPIVEGVVDYRGTVVPVLDIRARFRLPPASLDIHQHFIIADAQRTVAIRADRVAQVLTIDPYEEQSIEDGAPYVSGVVQLADGLVLIHDLNTFLSAEEVTIVAAAIEGAGA